MRLLRQKLENFQGIKSLELNYGGDCAAIFGDNATGKTTVFNAYTWLLFGKASTGAKGFNPKTKNNNGDVHNVEHASEASFETENGAIVTLRKVFREVYNKKRGSSREEFCGHTVDYFLDGVPVKEKEYNETVSKLLGDPEQQTVLTIPTYFSEALSCETRRKILLSVCGDVSDEEIIASEDPLQELPAMLLIPGTSDKRYSIEEYQKIASARRSEINREIQAIPARIDEVNRAMPDLSGLDAQNLKASISEKRKQIDAYAAKKSDLQAGGALQETRIRIAEVQARIAEEKAKFQEYVSAFSSAHDQELRSLRKKMMDLNATMREQGAALESLKERRDRLQRMRSEFMASYNLVASTEWDPKNAVCPTCHRDLPEDKVQQLREEFNLNKSRRLAEINAEGKAKASKDMIEDVVSQISATKEGLLTLEAEHSRLLEEIKTAEQATPQASIVPFEAQETYTALAAELAALEKRRENDSQEVFACSKVLDSQIADLEKEIVDLSEKLSRFKAAESLKGRMDALLQREKELSKEWERIERGEFLCELFIRAKVMRLNDRINSYFETVRFRLFVDQINGGVKEDCEVMIPSPDGRMVPFAFANNAARINAGLEIIDVLSREWNVSLPVFIDNAESVTKIRKTKTQTIRLVVSDQDKTLRMEKEI